MNHEGGDDRDRVKASEPIAGIPATGAKPDPDPQEVSERADVIDDTTAGDGVAFFEGGDGREAARDDIERSG